MEAWSYGYSRAPLVALHDDAVRVEQSRPRGLGALSGPRNYGLRKMVGFQ